MWSLGKRKPKSRGGGWVASFCCLVLFSMSVAQAGPTVAVHLPLDIRPKALRSILRKAMPGVDIKVYGRVNDFLHALKKSPPDAVLAFRAAIDTTKEGMERDLKIQLQGQIKGMGSEPYVLMSRNPIEVGSGLKLGSIDLMGRKKMSEFIQKLLGFNKKPKVTLVAKTEDLLTLLQFNLVDAILIPNSAIDSYLNKTQLELEITELSKVKFGLPAVGVVNQEASSILVKAFMSLDNATKKILRVEKWKKL